MTVLAASLMFFATLSLLNSSVRCILDVQVCDTLRVYSPLPSALAEWVFMLPSSLGLSAAKNCVEHGIAKNWKL